MISCLATRTADGNYSLASLNDPDNETLEQIKREFDIIIKYPTSCLKEYNFVCPYICELNKIRILAVARSNILGDLNGS